MIHELKTWPEYFERVRNGEKTFEIRKNDRDFQVGDYLALMEYDPWTETYSNRICHRTVSYIIHGGQFGIEPGYCVMGFGNVWPQEDDTKPNYEN